MFKRTQLLISLRGRIACLSIAAALPVALLLAPAPASADTFSVTAGDASSLQSALNQAAAHANSGGPDVLSIPAGTYTGDFTYTGDALDVEGAGRATTKLTTATGPTFYLNAPASTVAGLSIENTTASFGRALALGNQGGTVHDVELDATGNSVFGLYTYGDTSLSDARIVLGSNSTGVATGSADAVTVSRTTIDGSGGDSTGVDADSLGATLHVDRLRATGVAYPLIASYGGSLTARDSLLVLPAGVEASALWAGDSNSAGDFTSTLAAERLTIVGDPAANQRGAFAYANTAGDDFQISIHDSILVGVKTRLYSWATAGKASVTADWSSLPSGGDNSGGGATATRTNPVAGSPIFVDAAGGDYHQRYDSPLIDAGDPAPLAATDDLDGLARPVGRVDLGAYEYQRRAPVASATATPASASPGQNVTFVATASDPDPGDSPLIYSWSFDDGATAHGPNAPHAFTTAGAHTGTVTVTDPTGQSATAQATVTVAQATVTFGSPGLPGSAPAPVTLPDRTPPTITLLVKSHMSMAKALRHGIPVTIGCSEACSYRTTLLFDPRTAKALHIARRAAMAKSATHLNAAGRRTITIKLTRRARTALRGTVSIKLFVSATATDQAGNTSPTTARKATLRRR
jgi:PKD domain